LSFSSKASISTAVGLGSAAYQRLFEYE
jgi:hypothetical protein